MQSKADIRKPYEKRPLPAGYSPSQGTRILVNEIVAAVLDDEATEGCDIAAGMFGPKLSALLAELAACKEKADLFDMLEEALGHPANGTLQALSITKCELVGTVRIQEVRFSDRQVYRSGGNNLLEAARTFSISHPYDEEL